MSTPYFELWGEDADDNHITINSTKLVLVFKDIDRLKTVFNNLSSEGTIVTPLHKEFYTELTSEIIDKYGILAYYDE